MNIFGYILIVFTLIVTIVIGVKKPPMHSRVIVFDSQYEIVEEKTTSPVETVSKTEELPTMPVENTLTKVQTVLENQTQPKVITQEIKKVEQPKTVTKTTPKKVEQKATSEKTTNIAKQNTNTAQTQKQTTTVSQNPVTQTKTNQQSTPIQQTTQPVVQTTVTQTVPSQSTVKVLTAQQEEIAWNIWRSNLQNQIMKDTKMPNLPIGTVFRMSFNVDKNGKVTNVQTWSDNSKYTPYAIEFIAPVIRSYQGKAILDFPQGSQRTSTVFTGGWKIAQTSKYSTPANYNDIETIKVVK